MLWKNRSEKLPVVLFALRCVHLLPSRIWDEVWVIFVVEGPKFFGADIKRVDAGVFVGIANFLLLQGIGLGWSARNDRASIDEVTDPLHFLAIIED